MDQFLFDSFDKKVLLHLVPIIMAGLEEDMLLESVSNLDLKPNS